MSDSTLPPDQDDAVRALLAAARHTDPTPPDVVARLDAELAALTADRREQRAPVVTLASRRRRTAANLVLAAAAVVAVGVGIGQVLPTTSGESDSSAGSAADSSALDDGPMSAESGQDDGSEPETKAGSEAGASSGSAQSDAEMRVQATAPTALSGLSSTRALKPQVRQLRDVTAAETQSNYSAGSTCVLPSAASDVESVVSVTYNDLPSALVFRVPIAGRQLVDVFVCGDPVAVRSLTLRAP